MKRTKEEYLDLLNETVNFYSEDTSRRAMTGGVADTNCYYTTPEGKHCAVGRCLTNKAQKKIGRFMGDLLDLKDEFGDIQLLMKEKYQGFNRHFWGELQSLHDEGKYWNDDGLSQQGKRKYKLISEQIIDEKN